MTIGIHAGVLAAQRVLELAREVRRRTRTAARSARPRTSTPVAQVERGAAAHLRGSRDVPRARAPARGQGQRDQAAAATARASRTRAATCAAIGLDRRAGSGGSMAEPYRVISPDLPGQQDRAVRPHVLLHEQHPDDDSWLSPHNWDTVAGDWIIFLSRPVSPLRTFGSAPWPGRRSRSADTRTAARPSSSRSRRRRRGGRCRARRLRVPGGRARDGRRRGGRSRCSSRTATSTPAKGAAPTPFASFHGGGAGDRRPAAGRSSATAGDGGEPSPRPEGHAARAAARDDRPRQTVVVRWRATDADGGARAPTSTTRPTAGVAAATS